jgi:hypothetical protein
MEGTGEYHQIKRKAIFDILDKFPKAPSNALAKILKKENPLLFTSTEQSRTAIRMYRGKLGVYHREKLSIKKYFQPII